MQIKTSQIQMSESFWTITFLTLSGGFQDAYSYFARGKVFANAATGNLVLMASKLYELDGAGILHYLVPLVFFWTGLGVAQLIKLRFRHRHLHWRQTIVALEIVLLFLVPFMKSDLFANAVVSFACAMQIQTFRKVHGLPFSSTMTIGNMRSAIENAVVGWHTHHPEKYNVSLAYLRVTVIFFLGAGLGRVAVGWFGKQAVWGSCLLLLCSWLIMFFHPEMLNRFRKPTDQL